MIPLLAQAAHKTLEDLLAAERDSDPLAALKRIERARRTLATTLEISESYEEELERCRLNDCAAIDLAGGVEDPAIGRSIVLAIHKLGLRALSADALALIAADLPAA